MTKRIGRGELTTISPKLPVELWDRFRALADAHFPRVSTTALLEAAILEYLERHEREPKEG